MRDRPYWYSSQKSKGCYWLPIDTSAQYLSCSVWESAVIDSSSDVQRLTPSYLYLPSCNIHILSANIAATPGDTIIHLILIVRTDHTVRLLAVLSVLDQMRMPHVGHAICAVALRAAKQFPTEKLA